MIKSIIRSIFRKEWHFIFWFTLVFIVIVAAPHIYAYFLAGKGEIFTGLDGLTPSDFLAYYSYFTQISQGVFPIENTLTGFNDPSWPFSLFWHSAGFLASFLHLSPSFAFHFFRILLIPPSIVFFYIVISYFFSSPQVRKFTLLLLFFASGWGFYIAVPLRPYAYMTPGYYHWPMDLWVSEAVTFITFFHSPHFIVSLVGIVATLCFMYFALETLQYRYTLLGGLVGFFLLSFHPFHIISIVSVLGIYIFVRVILKPKLFFRLCSHGILFFLFLTPTLVYQWFFLQNHPDVQSMNAQNLLWTPVWWLAFISYGALIIFSILGVIWLAYTKKYHNKYIFLIVWSVVQFATLSVPLAWQRRLSAGLQVPLVFLSVFGLLFVWERFIKKWFDKNRQYLYPYVLISVILFGVFSASNAYVVFSNIMSWQKHLDPRFYISRDLLESFQWIKENTTRKEVFLSDYTSSGLLSAYTGRKVYFGHSVQTLDFEKRSSGFTAIWNNDASEEQKKDYIVNTSKVDYIFVPRSLKEEVPSFFASLPSWLKVVYDKDNVTILSVIKNPPIIRCDD